MPARISSTSGPGPARAWMTGALAALFLLLWTQQLSRGQDAPSRTLPEGFEIRMKAEPETATVGDPIRITLEVVHPANISVELPALETRIEEFTILEISPDVPADPGETTRPIPENSTVYRAVILVALYQTGEFEFPSMDLVLRDPAGSETTAPTPAVRITITSVLPEGEPEPMPLKKQAEIQDPDRWILWLALGLLTLMLAALAWWLWSRRRRADYGVPSRPKLDPLDLAEADLRDLLARGLLERGFVKPFYISLSEIVKKILEDGYAIPAVERTTSEIVSFLDNRPGGGPGSEERARIESFLISCDLVKFAKYIPSGPENESAVSRAFEILQSCRRKKPASAVAEVSQPAEVS